MYPFQFSTGNQPVERDSCGRPVGGIINPLLSRTLLSKKDLDNGAPFRN